MNPTKEQRKGNHWSDVGVRRLLKRLLMEEVFHLSSKEIRVLGKEFGIGCGTSTWKT